MSNLGTLTGAQQPGYFDYQPDLVAFSFTGAPTQPVLADGTAWGRAFVKPSGLVHAFGAITFGSSSTYGASDTVWGIKLPVPANRSSSGADIPIGSAWTRKALSDDPCPTMSLVPTLMDPVNLANRTAEDYFMQLFCPYLLAYGTGTITATTGNTITHNLGNAATGYIPSAFDVHAIGTETPTANAGAIGVESTSATQVSFAVKTDPGLSDLDFSWKIKSEPNASAEFALLVSYGHPWRQASGHVIGWNVEYEARR
jgi:hypothetical protein